MLDWVCHAKMSASVDKIALLDTTQSSADDLPELRTRRRSHGTACALKRIERARACVLVCVCVSYECAWVVVVVVGAAEAEATAVVPRPHDHSYVRSIEPMVAVVVYVWVYARMCDRVCACMRACVHACGEGSRTKRRRWLSRLAF